MINEIDNIKNNIERGREIYEKIPKYSRPLWAGLVLSRFNNYIKSIPSQITELFEIIENKDRWKNVRCIASKIRLFRLDNHKYQPINYLILAEIVAKVTYNASGDIAPFEKDGGHCIPEMAIKLSEIFDDKTLEKEVISSILLFEHNEEIRKDNKLNMSKLISFVK